MKDWYIMSELNLIDRAHLFIDKLDHTDFGQFVSFVLDISSSSDYVVIHIAHDRNLERENYIRILDILHEYFIKVDRSIMDCYIDEENQKIIVYRN